MVAYSLKVPQPEARRAEVSLECDTRGEPSLDVRLPVWTPGSYLIREHQRHVDGFSASDDSGRELPVEKIDKQTWRVRSEGVRRVRVSYRLGCFELTVRTNHVDPTHAFLNPAAACAYVVGQEDQPCTVRTELPPGWQTWVALPSRGDRKSTRLNSSHQIISYAVFCLKKKKKTIERTRTQKKKKKRNKNNPKQNT